MACNSDASFDLETDQIRTERRCHGRWHSLRTGAVSRRVICCAGTRALAQLEKRVHANGIAPVGQALFRLELHDGLVVSSEDKEFKHPFFRPCPPRHGT
jgi:hypothetical protein